MAQKPRIQYLEQMVQYGFEMESYLFAQLQRERLMREHHQTELHAARAAVGGRMIRGVPVEMCPVTAMPVKPRMPSIYVDAGSDSSAFAGSYAATLASMASESSSARME